MININIELDNNKNFKKIEAKGHSVFSLKGKDIVCSAVSVLLYSSYLSLSSIPGVEVELIDEKEEYTIEVEKYEEAISGEVRGITLFLIKGLRAIEKEYKDNLNIKL